MKRTILQFTVIVISLCFSALVCAQDQRAGRDSYTENTEEPQSANSIDPVDVYLEQSSLKTMIESSSGSGYAWDANGSSIYYNYGNVGIGTSSPAYPFEVRKSQSGWLSRIYNTSNGARSYFSHNNGYGAYINAGSNASSSSYALQVTSDNSSYTRPYMYVRGDGKVGIGTSNPQSQLHVAGTGNLYFSRPSWDPITAVIGLSTYTGIPGLRFVVFPDGTEASFKDVLHLAKNANVGIGTTNPTAKLTVKGDILCAGFHIENVSDIPDYVFEKDYDLMEINEVEAYIAANKHLPEVPSAAEFEQQGMDMLEMNKLLLKKLEEQTLYIIELNKRITRLENGISE